MQLIFANNAQSTLAGSISNTALTANLASGGGALFPNPTPGSQYFVGTFTDAATGLLHEIVWVTARSGDTITMTRAQEGTTALGWSANDLFAELWTAGQANTLIQIAALQAQATNYAVDTGATNALVVALTPALTANVVGMPIRVNVANTNTGATTMNAGVAVSAVVRGDGSACIGGELVAGQIVEFEWTGTAYMISGGTSPATAAAITAGTDTRSAVTPAQLAAAVGSLSQSNGSPSGLKVTNNSGTPNTSIDVSFVVATLLTATGKPILFASGSFTIDTTTGNVTSTPNGMDGEARPTSGWLYVWAISDGTNLRGLGSTSNSAPTMPAGYTYKKYLGAMRCNGSQNLMRTLQLGNRTQYTVIAATNTAALPHMASGVAGSPNTPTYVAVSVSAFVPPNASRINFSSAVTGEDPSAQSSIIVAPNGSYGSATSITNPPPHSSVTAEGSLQDWSIGMGEFVLESTNIYWASDHSYGVLMCLGWTDNYV